LDVATKNISTEMWFLVFVDTELATASSHAQNFRADFLLACVIDTHEKHFFISVIFACLIAQAIRY
jgi:hypothetical protein